jgi:hypothetical protein
MSTIEGMSLGIAWIDLHQDVFWTVTTYLPTQNSVGLLMDTGTIYPMIEASQNHTETHQSDVEVEYASSQGR